jgi:hypothetical protein
VRFWGRRESEWWWVLNSVDALLIVIAPSERDPPNGVVQYFLERRGKCAWVV